MRRPKRWGAWALFFGGLAVEFLAFTVDHSQEIPLVRKSVAADIVWMGPLLERLAEAQEVDAATPGFERFERLLRRDLQSRESAFRAAGYEDSGNLSDGLTALKPRFIAASDPASNLNSSRRTVRAEIASGGRAMLSMEALEQHFSRRLASRFLVLATTVFLIGVGLQLTGFWLAERGESGGS